MKTAENTFLTLNKNELICSHCWLTHNLSLIEQEFMHLNFASFKSINLDLAAVSQCDVNGAVLIHELATKLEKHHNITVTLLNIPSEVERLLAITTLSHEPSALERGPEENFFTYLGRTYYHVYLSIKEYLTFIGELSFSFVHILQNPSSFRMKEVLRGIQEHSIKALPIVLLTSMLIGLVVAYQSALQIKKYGADIFVVDMLIISVTRELAPLLTAIVVAGRSGSAYTAEIGVMKITEEIDAMRTMGFDPFRFIVLPNILALMIALPMIIFLADIFGIFGGMLAASMELDITPLEFINRMEEVFNINHLYVGLVKGPFFALIIASIGSMRGMAVENSTESIGTNTKASVVSAIFMVIICDAFFSIIFLELGI